MNTTVVVELPTGEKIRFGDAPRPPVAPGLVEASVLGDKAKAIAEAVGDASKAQFDKAIGALAGLVDTLQAKVEALPKKPSKIELEFGASLTGDCDLWIVSGEGKAEFKVKLTWDAPKTATGA